MQGSTVTQGLRKVTDDMKTKNRPDRPGMVAATAKSSAADAGQAPSTQRRTIVVFFAWVKHRAEERDMSASLHANDSLLHGLCLRQCWAVLAAGADLAAHHPAPQPSPQHEHPTRIAAQASTCWLRGRGTTADAMKAALPASTVPARLCSDAPLPSQRRSLLQRLPADTPP